MTLLMITPFIAFVVTTFTLPHVITIAKTKNLGAIPNQRSSHKTVTPAFGGIGILTGMLTPILLFSYLFTNLDFGLIFLAVGLIFLIGLKDDLIEISPINKLLSQIIAASLIVLAGLKITNLHGMFGIYELSEWISIPLTIFTIIVIVNAFNLIDGINGLSGSITILVCLTLGSWFYLVGANAFATLAAALGGAVIAFLRFNITPAKTFMGDSGSLVIGLVVSILILQFLEFHVLNPDHPYAFSGVPAIAISILIFPLFDTLRVFIIRILKGRSPLSPDRHHIHHMLLDAGFSHTKASAILVTINAFFIVLTMMFQHLGIFSLLGIILLSSLSLTLLLRNMVNKRRNVIQLENTNHTIRRQRSDLKTNKIA